MERAQLQNHHLSPLPVAGQPWLASRLLHRQVVNASTLDPLGRVTDVIFDPKSCQLVAISVQSPPSEGRPVGAVRRVLGQRRAVVYVGVEHIIALNGDVVVVNIDPAHPASSPPIQRMRRLTDVCDLTIITLHGLCLGALTDVLLDHRGSGVVGYVVRATKQAASLLAPFEAPERSPSQLTDTEAAAAELPAANLRFIPASPRVRIGDLLVLVVEDVEPLLAEPVVVTAGPEAQTIAPS